MLDKLKKSEKISFIATIILLITIISFIPILLNIKILLGIGYFNFDQNYISDYPEGRVGINIKISMKHTEGARCRGSILVKTISSGNIEVYGISQIEYSLKANNTYYSVENENINPATQIWRKGFSISVWKNDNVSFTGTTEVRYGVSGSEQTVTYNFDMSYVIPINVANISYVWDMPLIWLDFLYFVFLFVVIFFLVRKYRYIKHVYWYTEEMKKRDKKIFKYLYRKRQKNKE